MINRTYKLEIEIESIFGVLQFDMIPRKCIYEDNVYILSNNFNCLKELHSWASKVPDQLIQNIEIYDECENNIKEEVTEFINSIKEKLLNITQSVHKLNFKDNLDNDMVKIKVECRSYESLYIMNNRLCDLLKYYEISDKCIEEWLWEKLNELEKDNN